jgi:hypothetical protein
MPQKVNYYAMLTRAVATLERDAYGARGAVYDREHRAMLRRIALADPHYSEQEIAEEEQAFRDAIRRIEFPEPVARVARSEPPEPRDLDSSRREERTIAWREEREATPRRERDRERGPTLRESRWRREAEVEEEPEPEREQRGARIEPPKRVPQAEPEYEDEGPQGKPLLRRVVLFVQLAVLVGGVALLGYAFLKRDIDLSALFALPDALASSQRATLVETGASNAPPVVGKATWQLRTDSSESGKSAALVVLDVQIPERQIALTMSISREAEGGGMSHMFELQFARPEALPFGGISTVPKIVMKTSETDLGDDLIGTSIPVGGGTYLFGLLGTQDALSRNVQALKSRPWFGILINFAQGQKQILNIEKGAAGQKAINDALAKWGQ